jgi:8-oxo-dGTP pyrophosphatase MutT (NUDIX family)
METPFDVINKDGYHAIKNNNSTVAVIIYTLDDNELLDKIGIVTENNPHFSEGTYVGLVTGKIESDDPSLLSRAKIETKEESGYLVSDNERWDFLGEVYTSKILPDSVYCYSVDVTGLEKEKTASDTTKFNLVSLSKIEKIPDALLQTCFFKLFTKLYKQKLLNYGTA